MGRFLNLRTMRENSNTKENWTKQWGFQAWANWLLFLWQLGHWKQMISATERLTLVYRCVCVCVCVCVC